MSGGGSREPAGFIISIDCTLLASNRHLASAGCQGVAGREPARLIFTIDCTLLVSARHLASAVCRGEERGARRPLLHYRLHSVGLSPAPGFGWVSGGGSQGACWLPKFIFAIDCSLQASTGTWYRLGVKGQFMGSRLASSSSLTALCWSPARHLASAGCRGAAQGDPASLIFTIDCTLLASARNLASAWCRVVARGEPAGFIINMDCTLLASARGWVSGGGTQGGCCFHLHHRLHSAGLRWHLVSAGCQGAVHKELRGSLDSSSPLTAL